MNFKLIIDIIIVLIIFSCFYVMGVLAQELYSDYKNKHKKEKEEIKMENKKDCCCINGHRVYCRSDIMNKDNFLCGFNPVSVTDSNPVFSIDLEFVCAECRAVIRTKEFINGETKEIVKEMGYEIYRLKNLLNDTKNKEKRK